MTSGQVKLQSPFICSNFIIRPFDDVLVAECPSGLTYQDFNIVQFDSRNGSVITVTRIGTLSVPYNYGGYSQNILSDPQDGSIFCQSLHYSNSTSQAEIFYTSGGHAISKLAANGTLIYFRLLGKQFGGDYSSYAADIDYKLRRMYLMSDGAYHFYAFDVDNCTLIQQRQFVAQQTAFYLKVFDKDILLVFNDFNGYTDYQVWRLTFNLTLVWNFLPASNFEPTTAVLLQQQSQSAQQLCIGGSFQYSSLVHNSSIMKVNYVNGTIAADFSILLVNMQPFVDIIYLELDVSLNALITAFSYGYQFTANTQPIVVLNLQNGSQLAQINPLNATWVSGRLRSTFDGAIYYFGLWPDVLPREYVQFGIDYSTQFVNVSTRIQESSTVLSSPSSALSSNDIYTQETLSLANIERHQTKVTQTLTLSTMAMSPTSNANPGFDLAVAYGIIIALVVLVATCLASCVVFCMVKSSGDKIRKNRVEANEPGFENK